MKFLTVLTMTLLTALLFVEGCNIDHNLISWECRLDPLACPGENGSFCEENHDCASNYCCTDESNCKSGMCSVACDKDEDCPIEMACEHKTCFFTCQDDQDCAPGQSCEHDNTVCEWP